MANDKIPLVAVESSLVAMAGYHPEKRILALQFKQSGTIKHYAGISEELADRFFGCISKGRFLNTEIFNKFEVARMTGPCPNCGLEGWVGETCDDCGTADFTAAPARRKEDEHGTGGAADSRHDEQRSE